jgi:hypothetical protein
MPNPVRFTPLIAPRIFGDRDLRPYFLNIIEMNSGGKLNDRAPHAPTVVITDAFEFCRREIEYVADRMADKAATIHLQTCGIQRSLGRKAQVTLVFTLSTTLPQFILSKGYMVTGGGLEFFTDEDVLVNNVFQFSVTATAREEGTKYNCAAYSLTNLSQTRAYLASVVNPEPARGGLDAETEEEAKARGFQTIRRKKGVLISADDFEQYAQEILGPGSVAKAIGLLTPDKAAKKPGFVHIFCLNPDGTQLNDAQAQDLQSEMSSQLPVFLQNVNVKKGTPIASGVTVSSLDLYPLEVSVIATLVPGDNPETRAQAINQALIDYLSPGRLPLGQTIVLYSLVSVVQNSGVEDVQSVSALVAHYDEATQSTSVESFYGNIPLPNEWTVGFCLGTFITLVDPANNQSFEFLYGDGGDLD